MIETGDLARGEGTIRAVDASLRTSKRSPRNFIFRGAFAWWWTPATAPAGR